MATLSSIIEIKHGKHAAYSWLSLLFLESLYKSTRKIESNSHVRDKRKTTHLHLEAADGRRQKLEEKDPMLNLYYLLQAKPRKGSIIADLMRAKVFRDLRGGGRGVIEREGVLKIWVFIAIENSNLTFKKMETDILRILPQSVSAKMTSTQLLM